ncbi:unnamed protein product [Rotaria sp. Silwood1]|nr:unnamed protein product [Rotaria sp. Silwood1]
MAIDSEKQVSSSDSTIVRIVDNIKKSECDPWDYRGLELSNEMLIVLISHPNIDKAAAALHVSIGSLANPRDVPGIAHFLEHMLFIGSTKYPGENEYKKLIEGNGGSSNAFTCSDHTNYYFDINPSLLPDALDIFAQFFISPLLAASSTDRELEAVNSEYEGNLFKDVRHALDIFAQFFISPLFAASSTDRELEAVNSEYEGNLFKDVRRITQLEKSTSDSEHPYSEFPSGNTESLRTTPKQRGIDIREVLLDFYKAQYSSNRMSLAVLGNPQLEAEIIKTLERNDLLRFYDHYISPHSIYRRKLALHVNPSSLTLQKSIDEKNTNENKDQLDAMNYKKSLSNTDKERTQIEATVPVDVNHEAIKLTEQLVMIDNLIESKLKQIE